MKLIKGVLLLIILLIAIIYVAMLLFSKKKFPAEFGLSFNQDHVEFIGYDWKEAYKEMLTELKPKYLRIAAMWNDVEKEKGTFDFSRVDWMMDQAQKHNVQITLVVGQKAPRWPECHVPDWLDYNGSTAKQELFGYIEAVVNRYKDHPALDLWQVENEPFIPFEFGHCKNYKKEYVHEEIAFVKELDPAHKVLVTDSGEISTWHPAAKAGDLFGTTMYRVVRSPNGRRFFYDWLPAGYYRFKSALFGRSFEDFFVAELQAEPWFAHNTDAMNTPINIQEQTMNPKRLKKHIDYAERVGASRVYLWGVEWWYLMKEHHKDDRYWKMIKETLAK